MVKEGLSGAAQLSTKASRVLRAFGNPTRLTNRVKDQVTAARESGSILPPIVGQWSYGRNGSSMTIKAFRAARLRSFFKSDRGNIAMMFALSLVPLMIGAGAGLDFARAMLVRQQMGEALDAAALAVGSTTGLTQATAQDLAQKYFDANYTVDKTDYGTPTVSIPSSGYNSKGSVTMTATNSMPTVLVKLIGINTLPISTSSNVVWGQTNLWVALVLDNSGSMTQGDTSSSKMSALKSAITGTNGLLSILQNATSSGGVAQVSIVPFTALVKVGTAYASASWIDWTNWECPPQKTADSADCVDKLTDTDLVLNGHPLKTFGPRDSCPFDGMRGYICAQTPANDPNCSAAGGSNCPTVLPIPSSGTYTGYICPSMNAGYGQSSMVGHFYNGCWVPSSTTSSTLYDLGVAPAAACNGHSSSNCTCSSFFGNHCYVKVWTHTWVANSHSSWTGCVMDRTQNYDIANTTPSSTAGTKFPAVNSTTCGPPAITRLSSDWTSLTTQVNAMVASGATNQAIGIAHGWQSLTPGDPHNVPAVPDNTTRYIIFFSDGLNTLDRWWGDGGTEGTTADGYIDAREKATCDAAKAEGIVIYAIYVNIGNTSGNSAPLQYCASDATKYYALTTTSSITTTFQQIAQQISNLRVVK